MNIYEKEESLQNSLTTEDRSYFVYTLKLGSFIKNFTYLIIDKASRRAAIVDPAWTLEPIIDAIYKFEVSLESILLTHSHFDHVNMVHPLLKKFDLSVHMSGEEVSFYNFKCSGLSPVNHLDVLYLGETRILCLLTPGHTAGGLCFLVKDSLFSGDTIFTEGCGICSPFGASAEKMFESVQMIKRTLDPQVRIFPGHSFGKEPGHNLQYLMKENIYFQINNKLQFIQFRMRKNLNRFSFC